MGPEQLVSAEQSKKNAEYNAYRAGTDKTRHHRAERRSEQAEPRRRQRRTESDQTFFRVENERKHADRYKKQQIYSLRPELRNAEKDREENHKHAASAEAECAEKSRSEARRTHDKERRDRTHTGLHKSLNAAYSINAPKIRLSAPSGICASNLAPAKEPMRPAGIYGSASVRLTLPLPR
jgi:hypothetical protein